MYMQMEIVKIKRKSSRTTKQQEEQLNLISISTPILILMLPFILIWVLRTTPIPGRFSQQSRFLVVDHIRMAGHIQRLLLCYCVMCCYVLVMLCVTLSYCVLCYMLCIIMSCYQVMFLRLHFMCYVLSYYYNIISMYWCDNWEVDNEEVKQEKSKSNRCKHDDNNNNNYNYNSP